MIYRKFPTLLTLLVVLGTIAIVGCASPEAKPLKLGMLPITDNLPFWVAQEKGYFEEAGITVELIDFPSAMERDTAIQAGQIDGALGDMIAVAQLNGGGSPVRIVSVGQGATAKEGRFAILASPKSDIAAPEDLKNVEIACSMKTIMEYVIDELLTANGFAPSEIAKTQIVKIPLRIEALLNGTVQAAILPDPIAALAETKGARVIIDDTQGENITQTVIYFREETLDAQLDNVRKLMDAYAKAVDDINADPAAFDVILAGRAGVPQPVLESDNHGMEVLFSAPQLPTEEQVSRVTEWMTAHGILAKAPLYQDLIDSRVVNRK